MSDHEEQSTQNKRARGTPQSYDSEDQPLRKPPPYKQRTVHSPWLSSRDRVEQQLALDHLMRKDGIYDTKREKILKIFRSKIASKVKVAAGSGEKEGSKYHCVEIDLINTFAARSILWDLPRTGPTRRGSVKSFNWEVKVDKIHLLAKLLSFEENKSTEDKGWDNGVMRRGGHVMVAVIPPVRAEHVESEDTEKLVFTSYTAEVNTRGVISWPPMSIYQQASDYTLVWSSTSTG